MAKVTGRIKSWRPTTPSETVVPNALEVFSDPLPSRVLQGHMNSRVCEIQLAVIRVHQNGSVFVFKGHLLCSLVL
jgi:hypothetical protein